MSTASPDTAPGTGSPFEHALASLERELSVVFVGVERVEAACAALRGDVLDARAPEHPARVRRLLALLHSRTGPFMSPIVGLLRDAARAAPSPWPILEGMMGSRDAETCGMALDDALRLADAGALHVDLEVARSLGDLVEREDSPLSTPESIRRIAVLLSHLVAAEGSSCDPLPAMFLGAQQASSRRLAARVLDVPGNPPSHDIMSGLFSEGDAAVLGPLLTYTRASHLDLVDLVRRPGDRAPIAEALRAAESVCQPALIADVIGELGWRRVNLGFVTRPVVGISVDDSLPFLVTPAEAGLFAESAGTRRVFERVIVLGQGGPWDASDAGTPGQEAVGRFRAYNLAHAEVLADILDVAPLTADKVRGLLDRMDGITSEFVALFATRSDECAALPGLYASLRERIVAELASATPGRPLSVELTRLVQMFEDPASLARVQTLHGLKRYLHQRGLALGFGLLESSGGTNRTVDLVLASPERVLAAVRRIEYVDFDPDVTPAGGSAPLPYPVAIVADGFARQMLYGQTSFPLVRVFCYGNEVHYFVSFRNHPVFIRIDFSPPLGGGMIDLAYYGVSKYELDAHPGIALEAIQAFFKRLDFFVEVDNTRIHARYDKERALDLADLCDKAEAIFRLVPYLMDLDWIVGSLDIPEEARRTVGREWADLFARWGVLPTDRLLTEDRTGVLVTREARPEGVSEVRWPGVGPYEDSVSARPRRELAAEVHAALTARGFDVPLVEREVGQLSLEKHLLLPVRAALARGELVVGEDGLRPSPPEIFLRQHEADLFARVLASDDATVGGAAHMARLATALERSLRFETTGHVNGYDVQRAHLALRGDSGSLYALRDAAGIFRLAMYAPGGALHFRRKDVAHPWQENVSWDVGALVALLRRNNFLPSWIDAAPGDEAPEARQIRALFDTPNPRGRIRLLPGERAVSCLKASPGRAVALARLGTRGRDPHDLEGGVLFASTMCPEDQPFLLHAAAIVGTGGGILSHAGLMAVQSGRPAVIMPGTWREEPDGASSIAYRRSEYEERERVVAGHHIVERCGLRDHEERVREGDLVVVDADEGVLRVLGQSQTALALHDALCHLADASRRLAQATSPDDVLPLRGRRLRAVHQLERLIARMDEPALVQHAVRELLAGAAAEPAGVEGRERVRVLQSLRANPATGAFVVDCIRRVAHDVSDRQVAAYDLAARLIPSAQLPDEVLALRAAAGRQRGAFLQVRALLESAGFEAPRAHRDPDVIDVLARERLEAMLARLLQELAAPFPAGDEEPRLRHVVRRARRLAEVIGARLDDAEAIARHEEALRRRDESVLRRLAPRLVLWPGDGGLEVEPLAGSKAANLGELHRIGAAAFVPAWFVVTDRAFRVALGAPAPHRPGSPWSPGGAAHTLGDAIDAVVTRTDADAAQKSALVRQLWADVHLPPDLVAEVVEAYRRLGDGDEPYVAIRSSAREEDTESAVRAGEFDTFLFVKDAAAVVEHLKRAWGGLWTARAIHDRSVFGREGRGEGGGVVVQRIAWSRVAGVLQTTNVAEGRTREMVVNVGLGLGEGIVSGAVAADHVVVSREENPETEPLRFHYVTSDKRERVVFDARLGRGTVRTDVLSHQRLRAALEYVELVELVRIAARLEAVYGYPLDIEFGFEGSDLRLLQVRPVPGSIAVWHDAIERNPLQGARAAVGDASPHHGATGDGHRQPEQRGAR